MNKTETRAKIKELKAKRKEFIVDPTPKQRRQVARLDKLIASLERQLENGIFPKRLTKKQIEARNKERQAKLNKKKDAE